MNFIPVTDHKPPFDHDVLISRHDGQFRFDSVSIGRRLTKDLWEDYRTQSVCDDVVAWCEKPEPYKVVSE